MATDEAGFTAEQAISAQRAMRAALGLGAELFPLPAFIGMISDEVEQLRAAGRSDGEICTIVGEAAGRRIEPADLARFYAPPELRRPKE